MVMVSIEVYSETARFAVAVQAKSLQRALSVVAARYPDSVASVKFPIDPAGFFLEYSSGVSRGGYSLRSRRNGQVATYKPRKLEKIIMQTATLDRTDEASSDTDCLRVRSTENEPRGGTERSRETL